jgi:predicted transcriptional regulator
MPSTKPTVSVRLPDELLEFVDRIAVELDRSRNWVIVDMVRRAHEDSKHQ